MKPLVAPSGILLAGARLEEELSSQTERNGQPRLLPCRIPAGTEAAFAFRDEIARTRAEGVARNKGEHIEGIGSVGIWVARTGSTQLAASVAFPMFSVPEDIWERAEHDLHLVAEEVGRQLAQR